MFSGLLHYLGALFLGWGLGANDSANVFGMAVGSKMVSWKKAAVLTAFFVVLGAILQGGPGIETLAVSLAHQDEKDGSHIKNISISIQDKDNDVSLKKVFKEYPSGRKINASEIRIPVSEDPDHPQYAGTQVRNAMIMSFSAALTVAIMTILKLPVSTSQAVVGAIIGVNLMRGSVRWDGLIKVVLCWIGTPVGSIIFTLIFYFLFRKIINKWKPSALVYDRTLTILLILTGCYGAYALGANNVANVSAVFVSAKIMSIETAKIFGGLAIAVGVITYSKPVMMTVGSDIVKLDSFMAFITVLSLSLTVWIYALIGVPVSTTQAVVGAVLGFGLIKGGQTINFKTLGRISTGWLFTPIAGGVFAALAYFICNLHYVPS
jgi:PiT family inorganic phosphate transporter